MQIQQAVAFERSLDLFFRDCAKNPDCAFHQGGKPAAAYDRLRARIDAQPIAADGAGAGRTLNTTLFDTGVTEFLYSGSAPIQTGVRLASAIRSCGRVGRNATVAMASAGGSATTTWSA